MKIVEQRESKQVFQEIEDKRLLTLTYHHVANPPKTNIKITKDE